MQKEVTSVSEALSSKIRALEQQTEGLRQNAQQDPSHQEVFSATVIEELQTSLEELHVAEEELHQQNEELILAQRTLAEERQRYRDLFEFAPDGYVVTDPKGIVREANQAAARILGVPQRALVGKPLVLYFAKGDHASFYTVLQRVAQGEDIYAWSTAIQPRTRGRMEMSVNVVQQDRGGQSAGLLWLLHDITEQVHAREQLRALNAELDARVQQRTAELQRSNEELQQFAYVASHDLQEPLRAVSIYTQMVAERYQRQLDSRAEEFFGYIVEGTKRMQQLIRDLLEYSRVQTTEHELSEVEGEELLTYVLESLQPSLVESQAVVTHDSLPRLWGDSVQLRQVMQNLLSNALKFRGVEPPRIHIGAHRHGPEWVFSVHDNGIGLDPKQAERIFVIFQRLHTQREYPGTGMGLAICKRIIDRHGGRIWVDSQPGHGATFYFTLPIQLSSN
jgi:PAS domain S-box-containing protein